MSEVQGAHNKLWVLKTALRVWPKRRYRDRWNGKVLTRIGKRYGRALRVKAVFLARGSQKQWVRDVAARDIRRTVRSQCLTTLRLAGQWLGDPPQRRENKATLHARHVRGKH